MQSTKLDIVSDLFQGKLNYETTCATCGQVQSTPATFMELTLQIHKSPEKRRAAPSVSDCIERYLGVERLVGENQYECGSCKGKCDAERRIVLRPDDLPDVLTLHLMRFVYVG